MHKHHRKSYRNLKSFGPGLALLFLLMSLTACMNASADDNYDDNNPSDTSYYDNGYNQQLYESTGLASGLGYHTYSLGYPIYSSKSIQVIPEWITAGTHRAPYQPIAQTELNP